MDTASRAVSVKHSIIFSSLSIRRRVLVIKVLACMLLGAIILLMPGCQTSSDIHETTSVPTKKQPLIGLSMDTLVIERWESDRNIFVAAVNALGGEVIVQNANSDSLEQQNQIRYLIGKGIDVLMIIAIDEIQLKDEITLAKNNGIKVIAYDRMINHPGIDLFVSFDNQEVGRLMADAVITAYPAGKYVIMNGANTDKNTIMIRKGIQSVLDQHPECMVVAEETAENWSADDAFAKFKIILEKQKTIDGIICGNDAIAGAAVRALALYKKSGKVAVSGQDADLDACQRIVEGRQWMTVYKPIADLAKTAAKSAMALAVGQTIDAKDTISVNDARIPYIRIKILPVNQQNIADVIIKNGFHSSEDVYRNVSLIDRTSISTQTETESSKSR